MSDNANQTTHAWHETRQDIEGHAVTLNSYAEVLMENHSTSPYTCTMSYDSISLIQSHFPFLLTFSSIAHAGDSIGSVLFVNVESIPLN